MGAPGTGKTTSLENLIRALPVKSYVIEGDIESDIDTERLKEQGISRRAHDIYRKDMSFFQLFFYMLRYMVVSALDIKKNFLFHHVHRFHPPPCHLDAPLMHNAIHNMEMDEGGILFIENVGNLVCLLPCGRRTDGNRHPALCRPR